jgi:hypothetical protein
MKPTSRKGGENRRMVLQMWNESAVLLVCTIEKENENSESLFGRLGYWNCGRVGGVDIRSRASDVAGSSAVGKLFTDAGDDDCHSDCVASFDGNEFTIIECLAWSRHGSPIGA